MDKECDWRTSSGKVFQFFGAEIRKAREPKESCDVEVLIVECRESGFNTNPNPNL